MPTRSPADRLSARVDRSGGPDACWPWTGGTVDGYGRIRVGPTNVGAHRLAWELEHGPVPDGKVLDHTCHNGTECPGGPTCPHRRCCNPRHAEPVTRGTNATRSHAWSGNRPRCPQGHERTEDNLVTVMQHGRPVRLCRTCRAEETRRQNERARRLNIGAYAYRGGPHGQGQG